MFIRDAFKQASDAEIHQHIKFSDLGLAKNQLDDYQILRMAAEILRNHIRNINDNESYISCFDLELRECGKFVPDCLYDFFSASLESVPNNSNSDNQFRKLKIIVTCQSITT